MKKTGKISRSAYKSPIFPGGFIFLNLTLSKRVSWIIRETWRIFRPLPVTRFSQRSKRNAHTAAYTVSSTFSPPSSSSFSSRRKSWLEEKRLTCLHFAEWEEGAKGCAINGRSQLPDKIRGGRAFKWRNFREWAMMREREREGRQWRKKLNKQGKYFPMFRERGEKSNAFKRRQSLNIRFHTRISTFAKVYLEKLLYGKSFPINCLFHNRIYDGFPWKQDFTYNTNVPLSKIVRILRFHFSISEKYNLCDPYWLKYFEKGILKKLG